MNECMSLYDSIFSSFFYLFKKKLLCGNVSPVFSVYSIYKDKSFFTEINKKRGFFCPLVWSLLFYINENK
ncbi:hypothetical protein TFKS16_1329 [Tannerella forsythia KS16]|nr:hypothetical protein TFKS16_1329 [Tannerella forsythia KS16]